MQLSWERCYSLVSFVYMMKISRWDRMQTVNTVWHGWTIEFLRETSVKSPAHQTIRLPWGHNSYHHAVHVDTCWLKGPTYRNAGKREQPLGKRFGVNTGYLLVGREDSWMVKHSGGTFRNSLWEIHITFSSLWTRKLLSGCCQCTGPIPVTYIHIYICSYI